MALVAYRQSESPGRGRVAGFYGKCKKCPITECLDAAVWPALMDQEQALRRTQFSITQGFIWRMRSTML